MLLSQTWVSVASREVMRPAVSALMAKIVKRPLTWLQPRPVDVTERPPDVLLNGARVAFSYDPVVSC